MAHVFVLIEGRELWVDLFLSDLLKQRYYYTMNDGCLGMMQPNPREIRLFDISLPEECIPQLMNDIGPRAENSSQLRGKGHLLSEGIRIVAGLKSLDAFGKESNWIQFPVRRQWLNIMPIGWAEDKKIGRGGYSFLPKGGELV